MRSRRSFLLSLVKHHHHHRMNNPLLVLNASSSSSLFHRRRCSYSHNNKKKKSRTFCCSFSSSSSSSSSSSYVDEKTLIPLNERKATFDSTREELKRWQTWAKEKITKSKGAFSSFDGGNKDSGQQSHHHRHHHHDTTNNDPVDEQSLVTELEWLLEDVVANEGKSDDISMRMNFDQLTALWNKRIDDRYPIQYLTKSSQFRTVSLYVAPGVLIPRPETELLIDFAYQHVKIYGKNEHLKELPWLDLGTGSGAIACALATELKDMFSKTNPYLCL